MGYREDISPLQGSEFGHTGIYIGQDRYISHSSYKRVPVEHSPELRDGRMPEAFYAHDKLFAVGSLPASSVRPFASE